MDQIAVVAAAFACALGCFESGKDPANGINHAE